MLKFFMMVFDGFIWFTTLFSKWFGFLSSFSRYVMFGKSVKIFLYLLFYAFLVAYVLALVAFFYYLVQSIINIFNLISFLINYLSTVSMGGDSISSTMFYFLNISGITTGLSAVFPFIASALMFHLVKALYRATLHFYTQIKSILDTTLNTLS